MSRVQPDAPTLPKTPLELLQPRADYTESLVSQYGRILLGGAIGVLGAGIAVRLAKRPYLSGIHEYFIYGAIGTAISYYFQRYREKQWAERDAVLRHYVELHPADFPPYSQKKIGEIFEPWYPMR